jgi:hypothetical protein
MTSPSDDQWLHDSTELEALYALAEQRSQEMARLEFESGTELSDASAYLMAMESVPRAGALALSGLPTCLPSRPVPRVLRQCACLRQKYQQSA